MWVGKCPGDLMEEFNHLYIGPSLDEEEKRQIGDLLWKYDVFTFSPGELDNMDITNIVIDMGDAPPVHVLGQRPTQW